MFCCSSVVLRQIAVRVHVNPVEVLPSPSASKSIQNAGALKSKVPRPFGERGEKKQQEDIEVSSVVTHGGAKRGENIRSRCSVTIKEKRPAGPGHRKRCALIQ